MILRQQNPPYRRLTDSKLQEVVKELSPFPVPSQAIVVATCIICATLAVVFGCQPSPPVEHDSPVTAQRLSGARLTDIQVPLTWRFSRSTVVIEFEGQPIPSDLVEALLGDNSTPVRIEATWSLDQRAAKLRLSDLKADNQSVDKEVVAPISPAGHVRVNLGARQYNLFRESPQLP